MDPETSRIIQIFDSQWQTTVFSATPKLPTYLLAFSVMPDKAYLQVCHFFLGMIWDHVIEINGIW